MERIYEISARLTASLNAPLRRYLYDTIMWDDRLIMIKGARGVGKTTMMMQRCKNNGEHGVYASLDQLFFNDHTIVELADYHYKHGGTHLYLDEVHRYPRPNWEQELKNIHDSYPDLHVVFTGSSLLQLNSKAADLSRRVAIYELRGLSFREYLNFSGNYGLEPISLSEILNNHRSHASKITSSIRVIGEFEKYLKKGYYPFFMDCSEFTYSREGGATCIISNRYRYTVGYVNRIRNTVEIEETPGSSRRASAVCAQYDQSVKRCRGDTQSTYEILHFAE